MSDVSIERDGLITVSTIQKAKFDKVTLISEHETVATSEERKIKEYR